MNTPHTSVALVLSDAIASGQITVSALAHRLSVDSTRYSTAGEFLDALVDKYLARPCARLTIQPS